MIGRITAYAQAVASIPLVVLHYFTLHKLHVSTTPSMRWLFTPTKEITTGQITTGDQPGWTRLSASPISSLRYEPSTRSY